MAIRDGVAAQRPFARSQAAVGDGIDFRGVLDAGLARTAIGQEIVEETAIVAER